MSENTKDKTIEIKIGSRMLVDNPIFEGNMVISDDLKSISFELINRDRFSPEYLGAAFSFLCENMDALQTILPGGGGTSIDIAGWDIDGLKISNLSFIDGSFELNEDYGTAVLSFNRFSEADDELQLSIGDEGELVISQKYYDILIDSDRMNEHISDKGEFFFDDFIGENLPETNNKEEIFNKLSALIKENVVSNEFKSNQLHVNMDLSLFDVARWGKDELYFMVERKFQEQGIEIDIQEMEAIPLSIDGEDVVYKFVPTDYKLAQNNDLFAEPDEEDETESLSPSR
jgi:hypothetical protein